MKVTRVEQALPHEPKVIAAACPYSAPIIPGGLGIASDNKGARH
jgi:hypothetical protein